MSIREDIYARLAEEVRKQTPAQRARTVTSSGMPHYRVPDSMVNDMLACCAVANPCEVHRQYVSDCWETRFRNLAYRDGFRAGRLDRSLGIRLTYSSVSFATEPEYTRDYVRGYRDGQNRGDNAEV